MCVINMLSCDPLFLNTSVQRCFIFRSRDTYSLQYDTPSPPPRHATFSVHCFICYLDLMR